MRTRTFYLYLSAALIVTGIGLQPAFADTYTDVTINQTAGGQAAGFATSDTDSQTHAFIWLADGTLVDLQPAGYTHSGAAATNGSVQVGSAFDAATQSSHAVMWVGTADSVTDLNPDTGFEVATAADAISPDGNQQVGNGYGSATNYNSHALLWSSSNEGVIDLQPTNLTGFDRSFAYGTDGTHQVGYGGINGHSHALLWSGTAASAIDLQPASGFTDSFAQGVSGAQQVGYGYTTPFAVHALLWTGSAASAVDLNPAGYQGSYAYSTNGSDQVGYGQDASFQSHALLWTGTAASATDLSALLPADQTWTFSIAYDIDNTGDIFGWARGTMNGVAGSYAIEWTPTGGSPIGPSLMFPSDDPAYTATVLYQLAAPVPEPTSLMLIAAGAFGIARHRRRVSPPLTLN